MNDFTIVLADSEELKKKLFAIRQEVFVVEQKVDRDEEFDQFEDISTHFVGLDNDGNPIGAARWRTTDNGVKLERFAVKKSWRGKGVGSALVQAVLESIQDAKGGGNYLYMHAQLHAIPLYEKFGFQKVGEMFEECNIQHFTMGMTN